MAATGSGAGTAGAAPSPANRILGVNGKTIIGHVDTDRAGLLVELLFHHERKSAGLVLFIVIMRLIQSQRELRPRSTAGSKVNPYGLDFLALEIIVQLLFGSCGKFDHVVLLRSIERDR